MVSDQEIAKGVETLLRQSDPNSVTTINGVVQQLGAKLGLDLSHKAVFIRDQINFLLRSHPQPQLPPPKDHFALHTHPQFHTALHPQQFPAHFALHPHHRSVEAQSFQQQPSAPPPPQAQLLSLPVQPQPQPPPKPDVFPHNDAPVASEARKERFGFSFDYFFWSFCRFCIYIFFSGRSFGVIFGIFISTWFYLFIAIYFLIIT